MHGLHNTAKTQQNSSTIRCLNNFDRKFSVHYLLRHSWNIWNIRSHLQLQYIFSCTFSELNFRNMGLNFRHVEDSDFLLLSSRPSDYSFLFEWSFVSLGLLHKYLNCSTISNELLPIFIMWFLSCVLVSVHNYSLVFIAHFLDQSPY